MNQIGKRAIAGLLTILYFPCILNAQPGMEKATETLGLPLQSLTYSELTESAQIPEGFTPLFNGEDLSGWHISQNNFHGNTPDFRVIHGHILGTQNPIDSGGILLTDKIYKNFELFMEVKPDWGTDSGIYLRSNENGQAYQVTLDYIPGGFIGEIWGEGLERLSIESSSSIMPWNEAWHREEWNSILIRITGEVPRIQVWINNQLVRDWTDSQNHLPNGATDGMVAIQVHRNGPYRDFVFNRWVPGGIARWRSIAIKELPDSL